MLAAWYHRWQRLREEEGTWYYRQQRLRDGEGGVAVQAAAVIAEYE